MQQNTMVDSIECCRQVKKYQKDHLLPMLDPGAPGYSGENGVQLASVRGEGAWG